MKKTLIALAVLASSGAAMAQSTFTLYGIADVSFAREDGATSVNKVNSGGVNGSRWGLRGTEDLGGGLKAVFTLESGFGIDEGVSQQGGRLFGRQAFAGLEGGFGSLRLGRQYTPLGNVADLAGSTKTYDVLAVAGTYAATTAYRTDNAITYKTPSFGGLTVEGQYSTQLNGAETNTGTSPKAVRHYGFNAMYANGPITAGFGYLQVQDINATVGGDQKRKGLLAVAGYDFGLAKVTGYYSQEELPGPAATGVKPEEEAKIFGLHAAFPFGAFTVTPGFAIGQDLVGDGDEDKAKFFTLQTTYDLSKRTALYGFLTYVDNEAGMFTLSSTGGVVNAARGFSSPQPDDGSYGIAFGVRHRF